ncbi:hypothetical protein H4W34_002450 [Actinomadura algeriensis]|uniref:Uncharacterized protein n=1 Tax=Actinomadura algeriensis TaxID=1679523 RepID=A0ABR9JPY5_9ACTN|nr:hypothetical protein [Actinomadura algeriensis]
MEKRTSFQAYLDNIEDERGTAELVAYFNDQVAPAQDRMR